MLTTSPIWPLAGGSLGRVCGVSLLLRWMIPAWVTATRGEKRARSVMRILAVVS